MKKNSIYGAALLAALTIGLLASCAKEENQPGTTEPETPVVVEEPETPSAPSVISAGVPEDLGTKVALEDKGVGNGVALTWQEGDQLRVIATAGGSGNEAFTITEGWGTKNGKFSGTPVDGTEYTVFYPGDKYADVAAITARDYTSQTQTGNGSTAHLEWNAIETGLSQYGTVTFENRQNGVLRFLLRLPAGFTTVEWVSLSAGDAIFSPSNDASAAKVNELKLNLSGVDVSASEQLLTAYLMVSWNDSEIPAGTELTVKVKGEQPEPWVKTKTIDNKFTISGGKVTNLPLDKDNWTEPLFWAGDGTASAPYEIKTAKHLQNMNDKITENAGASTLYFKLISDIDLSGVSMDYSNGATANIYPINFNGDGYTISNFKKTDKTGSLFGKLNGEVYNVKFKNATVTPSANSSGGILAFRAGNDGNPVSIHDITIDGLTIDWKNSTASNTTAVGGLVGFLSGGKISRVTITNLSVTGTGNNIGGLVGQVDVKSEISACTISGEVTGQRYVGGIVGYNTAEATEIKNCDVSGSVSSTTSSASDIGGVAGRTTKPITVSSCSSSAAVSGWNQIGGIIGCGQGTVEKCVCTGKITTKATSSSSSVNSYTGGISGFNSAALTISECLFSGSITGTTYSHMIGGIVGCQNSSNALTLKNCCSEGTITTTRGYTGGLIGQVISGVITVSNSYSTMSITAGQGNINGLGGLFGGEVNNTADCSWNVSGCLAWNNKIEFYVTNNLHGVIIGQVNGKESTKTATLKDCYYKHDLNYTTSSDGTTYSAFTITPSSDYDNTTAPGKVRYNGKDAGENVSCLQQAKTLDWDDSIWNLTTGEYPTLNNLP